MVHGGRGALDRMKPAYASLMLLLAIILPQVNASLEDAWAGRVMYYPCEMNGTVNSTTVKVIDEGTSRYNLTFAGYQVNGISKVSDGACWHTIGGGIDNAIPYLQPFSYLDAMKIYSIDLWFRYESTGTDWDSPISFLDDLQSIAYIWTWESQNYVLAALFHGATNAPYNQGNITPYQWHHVVATHNGSHDLLYRNGVLKAASKITANDTRRMIDHISYGGSNSESNFLSDVYTDNMLLTSHNYSAQDVLDSYNNYLGFDFLQYEVEDEPEPALGIYVWNTTQPYLYKSLYSAGEDFYIGANFSLDNGSQLTTGSCNVTLFNASVEYEAGAGVEVCVSCGSILRGFLPAIEPDDYLDVYHLTACRNGTADLNVTVACQNGSVERYTIPSPDLPPCTTGAYLAWFQESTICLGQGNLSLTLSSEADAPESVFVESLALDRYSSTNDNLGGIDVLYNATSSLYEVTHTHEYYPPGAHLITAECREGTFEANASLYIYTGNPKPLIVFDSIKAGTEERLWGENLSYSQDDVRFDFTAIDYDLAWVSFNLTNTTGIVYAVNQSSNPEVVIPGEAFRDFHANPYTYIIKAGDLSGQVTTDTGSFHVEDTISPICVGFGTVYAINLTETTLSASCYDEALFSLNVSCQDGYRFGVYNIIAPSYEYSDTWTFNDSTSCSWEVCDAHTKQDITGKVGYAKVDKGVKVKAGKGTVTFRSEDEPESVVIVQDKDRVRYTFKFPKEDKKKPGVAVPRTFIYEAPEGSSYIPDPRHAAWIVSPTTRTWFDADQESGSGMVEVEQDSSTAWRITVWGEEDTYAFQSIGLLNCYNGTFQVEVIPPPPFKPLQTNTCPDSTPGVLVMGIAVLIALFLLVMGVVASPVFGVLGSMLLLSLSWVLHGCFGFLGWAVAGVSLIAIAYFALSDG